MSERVGERVGGWVGERVGGWVDESVDGGMNGHVKRVHIYTTY